MDTPTIRSSHKGAHIINIYCMLCMLLLKLCANYFDQSLHTEFEVCFLDFQTVFPKIQHAAFHYSLIVVKAITMSPHNTATDNTFTFFHLAMTILFSLASLLALQTVSESHSFLTPFAFNRQRVPVMKSTLSDQSFQGHHENEISERVPVVGTRRDATIPADVELEHQAIKQGNLSFSAHGERRRSGSPLRKWKRRLTTHQDRFSIHKSCGIANLASCVAILFVGASNGFVAVPVDQLKFAQSVFQLSTLGLALSALRMSLKYRSNEVEVRNIMINSAIGAVILAYGARWVTPFYEQWMGTMGGQYVMVGTILLVPVISLADINPTFIRKAAENRMSWIKEYNFKKELQVAAELGLFLTMIGPFLINVYTALFYAAFSPEQYFHWLDQYCLIDRSEAQAIQFYSLDIGSMALLYSPFVTTLKDRKLIPPEGEGIVASLTLIVFTLMSWNFIVLQMLPLTELFGPFFQ